MLPAITLLATLLPLALAQYYGADPPSAPTSSKASASAAPTGSSQGVHIIEVGNGGTKFTPDTMTVPVGDSVEFRFYPSNHSVVQSSFDSPCTPINDQALFSGFQPVQSGVGTQSWTIKINDTKSIWLYCSQSKHCQSGMSVVINPPSDKNVAGYKSAASNVSSSASPATIQGGVLGPLSASGTSSATPKPTTGAGVRCVALGDAGRFVLAMGVLFAASML